jgi:magnesium transporter
VRPQRAVLRDLERTKQRYLQEELEIYFDDISDAAERTWDTLENYKEVIEALESTNESVLSHRLNDSFRVLTAASVLLLPLTLIASIWGMNVPLPLQDEPLAFITIMFLMAGILILFIAYFRRRGWL